MSTNKNAVDTQSELQPAGDVRSASGNNNDSVDDGPQSIGLLETQSLNEYQSITDEDQGSSTKSSQAAAADAIPPEDAAVAMQEVPLYDSPNSMVPHCPTESNVIAVLDQQKLDGAAKDTEPVPAMEDTASKKQRKEGEYIKYLKECCKEGDEFDYYQMMAFHSKTKSGTKDQAAYMLRVIKASICAITQVLGMVIIMVDFAKSGQESREDRGDLFCNPLSGFGDLEWHEVLYDLQLKILAFLFSSFLAFFCFDRLTAVDQTGMYWKMDRAQNVKFLNYFWLRIGFSINVIASILAVYGSFMIVFFSDNSLDMILNSVALFFVVELDDLLVKSSDYKMIGDYIEEYQSPEGTEKRRLSDASNEEESCPKCKGCVRSCCSAFVCCVAKLYTLPFQAVRYFTIAMCVVLPFFLGYCW